MTSPQIIVAQAQDSISRFAATLQPGGTLLVDSDMVSDIPDGIGQVYGVAATSIARNEIKAAVTANIVMLGALCRISGVVGREALQKAIEKAVPKGKKQLNLEAFARGFDAVAPLRGNS